MLAITQEQLDAVVREAYEHANACCVYAPTDRSFPVGEDGRMDCTGLMLRALWWAGYVDRAMNCDEADQLMGDLGFVKSTDINDVYTHHGFVQWCHPHNAGTIHVNHTYYSLGGDGRTIAKYDLGAQWRIQSPQPFYGVPVDEWGGQYVFKHIWYPRKKEQKTQDHGIFLQIGGD